MTESIFFEFKVPNLNVIDDQKYDIYMYHIPTSALKVIDTMVRFQSDQQDKQKRDRIINIDDEMRIDGKINMTGLIRPSGRMR